MTAPYTFRVTINDTNDLLLPRVVVEATTYNRDNDSTGEWHISYEGEKYVWELTGGAHKRNGYVGGLRIKNTASNDGSFIAVFGCWRNNEDIWVGIAPDLRLSLDTTMTLLPKFYGGGEYNKKDVYWSQDNHFEKMNSWGETISIDLTPNEATRVIDAVITIKPN